jgi:hypothetical protein
VRAGSTIIVCAFLLSACAGPGAGVTGNDTGGIIPYAAADPAGARELALAHCARYDKLPRATGVDPQYGGYYSFACEWDRRGPH